MKIFSGAYYDRYFKYLEVCGGCVILGKVGSCRYYAICTHVERLANKGVVQSSEDFIDSVDLGSTKPAKLRFTESGIGPCETD